MEKHRIYDEVISVLISNAGAERQRNGVCLLRSFNPSNPRDMLYYEASLIYCSIINEPLYLHMGLFAYLKFKLTHWKSHKQLKWMSNMSLTEHEMDANDTIFTSVKVITDYVYSWAQGEFGMSEDEFDRIYEEVYKAYDDVD